MVESWQRTKKQTWSKVGEQTGDTGRPPPYRQYLALNALGTTAPLQKTVTVILAQGGVSHGKKEKTN